LEIKFIPYLVILFKILNYRLIIVTYEVAVKRFLYFDNGGIENNYTVEINEDANNCYYKK